MTAVAPDLSLVPPLGEPPPQPTPEVVETTLDNGLRVVVVPRHGVPLVELRLRVPFAASPARAAATHTARVAVLSGAVLLGTDRHDQGQIAELLQGHGAELSVSADPDRLLFSTTLLAGGLPPGLDLLAELLTAATYPKDRVEAERSRVVERVTIARAQPGVIARTALAARRYGTHPYAAQLPRPELVEQVKAQAAIAIKVLYRYWKEQDPSLPALSAIYRALQRHNLQRHARRYLLRQSLNGPTKAFEAPLVNELWMVDFSPAPSPFLQIDGQKKALATRMPFTAGSPPLFRGTAHKK